MNSCDCRDTADYSAAFAGAGVSAGRPVKDAAAEARTAVKASVATVRRMGARPRGAEDRAIFGGGDE